MFNQENGRGDKLEQIKRILGLKESSDVKVYMISVVVAGGKDGKGLAELEINSIAKEEEEVL